MRPRVRPGLHQQPLRPGPEGIKAGAYAAEFVIRATPGIGAALNATTAIAGEAIAGYPLSAEERFERGAEALADAVAGGAAAGGSGMRAEPLAAAGSRRP